MRHTTFNVDPSPIGHLSPNATTAGRVSQFAVEESFDTSLPLHCLGLVKPYRVRVGDNRPPTLLSHSTCQNNIHELRPHNRYCVCNHAVVALRASTLVTLTRSNCQSRKMLMPSSNREAWRCLATQCTGSVTASSLQRLGTGLHMISRKTTKSLCHGSSLSPSPRPRTCIRAIAFSDPAKKPSLMWRAVNDRQSPRYRGVVSLQI